MNRDAVANYMITGCLLAAFGAAVLVSAEWPAATRRVPQVISYAGVVVSVTLLLNLFLSDHKSRKMPAPAITHDSPGHSTASVPRPATAQDLDEGSPLSLTASLTGVAWIIGFFLSVWLFGLSLGSALGVAAYLRLSGKERWLVTIFTAACVLLGCIFVFERLLGLPFPEGILREALF